MNNAELGILGEKIAINHIMNLGYEIIEKNYRFKKNEIDIIAQYGSQLIIIEVKTRHSSEIGEPWMAVNRSKQKAIIQVANQYIQSKQINLDTRFDIISIVHNNLGTKIEHIEDAFSS